MKTWRSGGSFRALHLKELAALFVQLVQLAGECGSVKLGTIAVGGTKLRANASKHKAMSYERMQVREVELKTQIDALLARAARADVAEADELELDIPAEIARRTQRVKAIEAAKLRLEARQCEVDLQRGRQPDDDEPPAPGQPAKRSKAVRAFKRAFGKLVALGREGKKQALINAHKLPHTGGCQGSCRCSELIQALFRTCADSSLCGVSGLR